MIPAGHRFDFHERGLSFATTEWRPLEHAIARWVLAHGGGVSLAEFAARVSLADDRGDSALKVEDAGVCDVLASSAWVGDAVSQGTPFVLDGDLFYLRRNFSHERAVARMLRDRLQSAHDDALTDASAIGIDALFAGTDNGGQWEQAQAVRKALGRRLFVLTGGPGTGKTTTVLRLLMAASRDHQVRHGEWPRIALAAPTGKAAQRMGESLRSASPDDFTVPWHDALRHVQACETSTLHRLLGSRGAHGGFSHDADVALDADIVVVDEASMLDLALLRALLAALPDRARLVLVGDADQLDSVGTGSVLQDIVEALGETDPFLQRLHRAHRADVTLQPLNEAVRIGDAAAFLIAMRGSAPQVVQYALPDVRALSGRLDDWAAWLLDDIRQAGIDRNITPADSAALAGMLSVTRRRQLLCALREGPFGASGLNAAIEARLAPSLPGGVGERWYPGRRVLITRNDPASGLFNGDIGLCLRDGEGGLRVWFDGGDGPPRAFPVGALPPHEPAFALTVHKAQGSEYEEVAVLPPPMIDHLLLSRQWFYTAISRARRSLQLWADEDAIIHAIDRPARRSSGLSGRIRGEGVA